MWIAGIGVTFDLIFARELQFSSGNAVNGPMVGLPPGASLISTRNQSEINQRGYCFAV